MWPHRTFPYSLVLVAVSSATTSLPSDIRAQEFVVAEATVTGLQEAMATGRVTAVQLVDAFLARIEAYDE